MGKALITLSGRTKQLTVLKRNTVEQYLLPVSMEEPSLLIKSPSIKGQMEEKSYDYALNIILFYNPL
jgi:hypothetical protein